MRLERVEQRHNWSIAAVDESVDTSYEILPSESNSQVIDLATTRYGVSLAQPPTKHARPAPTTDRVWQHFEISRVDPEWLTKRQEEYCR